MSLRPRWQRRAFGLWAGLVPAWAAVVAVGYIRFADYLDSIVLVATVLVLMVGVMATLRLRAADSEPFITVKDLRDLRHR